jgi:nucleolar GTP-binding protein
MPSSNPFRSITTILKADKLFSKVHDDAMKTSVRGTSEHVHPLQRSRRKEAARIEALSKELRNRLFRIVEEFPRLDEETITGFYLEILDLSFGLDEVKRTLGSLSGSTNVIWRIKREYIGNVWHAESVLAAKRMRRAAFGRMKSVIMKLNARLEYLEDIRIKMRGMPGIDLDQPTFCIAGYPNVGKSSLVNIVTSATPEIGVYPFTTKEVTLGHLKVPVFASDKSDKPLTHISVQVVDTPGILDRPLEERNIIERKAMAALKTLATAIVFIFDFTQLKALTAQKNLLNQITSNFQELPFLIICGKEDLLDEIQKKEITSLLQENYAQFEYQFLSMNDHEKAISLLTEFYMKNHTHIQQIMKNRESK